MSANDLLTPPRRRALLAQHGLLLGAVFVAALCLVHEFDIAWYLAAGEHLLRSGTLSPAEDPFSYTATQPWMHHMWLTEILLALIYRVGGMVGLGLWQAIALVATMIALMWAHGRWGPADEQLAPLARPLAGLAPIGYAAAAMLLREVISPRGQLLSNLALTLTLALAIRDTVVYPAGGGLLSAGTAQQRRPVDRLWWTLVIGLVLTQVHGGNPHQVILLSLLFVAGPSWRRALYAAGAVAVTFAGPYGARVHEHFFSGAGVITAAFREWQSLPAVVGVAFAAHIPYVLFLGACAVALLQRLRRGERLRLQTLAFGFYTVAAVRYVRFLLEATLVGATLLGPYLAGLWRGGTVGWSARRRAVVLGAALALVGLSVQLSSRQLGFGFDGRRFPIGAVAFLQRARPAGPMFNSYNFGGYLAWRYPEQRVYIDGRGLTVYPPERMRSLIAVYDHPPRFEQLERRFGFRLAVVQRHGRGARFLGWLRAQPRWRVVYEDAVAVVLVRG